MARFKAENKTTTNKVDMSLDAIIKLQKLEKKKELKAKKQTLFKKQFRQRGKPRAFVTSIKSAARSRLNTKAKPGKKQNQEGQGKLRLAKKHFTSNATKLSNNNIEKQGRNSLRSKMKQTSNTRGRIANQQSSKKVRENVMNSRQQSMQMKQGGRNTSRTNNTKQQYSKNARENFVNSRRQVQENNPKGYYSTRSGRHIKSSFEDRLQQARENSSKLKVVVDNPKAKLSCVQSMNALDLIQMQLHNISSVTGNTVHEKTKLQKIGPSSDKLELYQEKSQILSPARVYPLRISVNNDLAQPQPLSSPSLQSLLFQVHNRINIPVEKSLPTLNERFSPLPVDNYDNCNNAYQGYSNQASDIIVID